MDIKAQTQGWKSSKKEAYKIVLANCSEVLLFRRSKSLHRQVQVHQMQVYPMPVPVQRYSSTCSSTSASAKIQYYQCQYQCHYTYLCQCMYPNNTPAICVHSSPACVAASFVVPRVAKPGLEANRLEPSPSAVQRQCSTTWATGTSNMMQIERFN